MANKRKIDPISGLSLSALADIFLCGAEHPLPDVSCKILRLFTVWVYPICQAYVSCQVTLLMVKGILELLRACGPADDHHRSPSLKRSEGKPRVGTVGHQRSLRPEEMHPAAPYVLKGVEHFDKIFRRCVIEDGAFPPPFGKPDERPFHINTHLPTG